MPQKIRWVDDPDDSKSKRLLCHKCTNGRFLISRGKVVRQAKTKTAHHIRLVATCAECREKVRIAFPT